MAASAGLGLGECRRTSTGQGSPARGEGGFRTGTGETGPVPITFQRMVDAKFALVGTVDQVKRQIAELCEASNPDWFGWYLDQGLMDQGEVLRQLEAFATEILPGFA